MLEHQHIAWSLLLLLLLHILPPPSVCSSSDHHHHHHHHQQHNNAVLHSHILRHVVRSTVPAERQAAAALAVIARSGLPPERARQFDVHIDVQFPANTFHVFSSGDDDQDRVTIRASSATAACRAFQHYLKYYCNCHLSWDGAQLESLPGRWPPVDQFSTAATPIVYYQNVCTWSYSFVWWQWPEWRRHIDWMALNGITLALAPVQELAWTQVYRELNMTDAQIGRHFAGPAFLAWQRMGNLRGWAGPLTEAWQTEQSSLQARIVAAQRELGMAVALPAFAGHVPVEFAKLFPQSTFHKASRWCRFSDANCCPLYINPMDPLFQTIGELYLRKITALYGASNHIYFSDPFNEMLPDQSDPAFVASASRAIFGAMRAVDPDAVWLLQGWMFVNAATFWTAELAEAFLRAVPLGRMLVLDLQSETVPQYGRLQSYYGQPFVWCMLHNFGGTLGMHGSVEVLNTRIAEARKMPNSTMIGFGLTMEGINQNYIIYEFALESGWGQTTVNAEKWFDHYALARYGRRSERLQSALQHLRTSVYSYNGTEALHGQYIVCKRPSLQRTIETWYNVSAIEAALRDLIADVQQPNVTMNSLLHNDIVDTTRQYLQTRVDVLYPSLVEAVRAKDSPAFQSIAAEFTVRLQQLERVLGTDEHFLLGPWLRQAHRWAETEAERRLIDLNARHQITLWGPNGEILDYAIKQWSEVVRDYCLPRWRLFFVDAAEAMSRGKVINMQQFQRRVLELVEKPFTVAASQEEGRRSKYETRATGDIVELAREALDFE